MDGLTDPLLRSNSEDEYLDESLKGVPTTDYATAGIFSQICFNWLGSVLKKGTSKTLEKNDVPLLCPEHRATVIYESFSSNWPKQREPSSVRRTLARTFGRQFLVCSLLALVRVSVMFAGPVLIQSFVQVTSGNESFPYEGYALVLILLTAKAVEVSASHLYQFNCQKVGIQVRSSLISTVYRKGIRLSSYARQSHGVGQIVNYMSVDVQQMSDVVLQLNNVWIIPAQIIIALSILFWVTGIAAIAGAAVMAIAGVSTFGTSKLLQTFQKRIMRERDGRMKATVETLTNMKIIKLQAWDDKFYKNVTRARQGEYRFLTKYMYTTAINIFTLWLTPLVACVAIFSMSVFMGKSITSTIAFTTIATVRIVQEPLRVFPQTLISLSQAMISLERLERFLWSDELQWSAVEKLPFGADPAITVEGGNFKWSEEMEEPSLQDINLRINQESFVAVVGTVGSGKTSLLAALLGEIPKVSGKVKTSGRIAYVAQQAWIQSGTIQENILFGLPLDKVRYHTTLNKCALQPDLTAMEFGDQTEIGERGLNLSGGQKQRIQLARAIYQNCDIYLLDDIFSAVDAHTGSELFRECIVGGLAGKTVVLVTHQIDFLRGADLILVMRDGSIVQSGRYEELLIGGTDFEALVEASNEALEKVIPHEPKHHQDLETTVELSRSPSCRPRSPPLSFSNSFRQGDENILYPGTSPSTIHGPVADVPNHSVLERHVSQRQWSSPDVKPVQEGSGRLTEDEQREAGRVSLGVYWLYFTQAYGGTLILSIIVIQIIWQFFQISADYWVAYGASSDEGETAQSTRFVIIYAALAMTSAFLVFMRTVLVSFMGLTTAQSFYLGMLRSLFRAPMSFFDTTPTGRILSRSSLDQATTDVQIPMFCGGVLTVGFNLLGVLVVTLQITWQVVVLMIPLGYIYYVYQRYYFATSRELTRVDAVTKAPVIDHFQESISGFVTIRCFQQQERFIQTNVERIDSNLRMDFHNQAATEWVGLRMEFIGILILCASTLLLVALPEGYIKPELVGLCLTYGMNLNGSLFVVAWLYCQVENKMVSVERIGQYTRLPTEADLSISETKPSATWPTSGKIVLQNLKLRYRPHTPLVLKGVTVSIKGGHKVGVVGRTGSGKSTLILALFRLVEPAGGSITIDEINVSSLGLNDLRSRLSIIPQDPTLFDGTVRTNLDPLGEHSDSEIWEALEKCQLASNVKLLEGKLDAPVLENGENWSLGQRQLFCLGRVLLKRSRILVLDEATASVDAQTDAVMQRLIRQEFADSTVISIAHRIHSVMDSDKVLVLDAGRVQEYASPSVLLDNPNSLFTALVREYSARSVSYADLVSLDSQSTG